MRHAFFFVHFFTVTERLGREKALNMLVRNSAPEEFACISQSKRIGDIAVEIGRTQIHFLSNVFVTVAVVVSLSPAYCCEIGRCFKLVISNFLFQACKEVRFVPHKMSNRMSVSICWRYALMTYCRQFYL